MKKDAAAARLSAGIKLMPSYFLCSKDGEIRAKETGFRDRDTFLKWLDSAAPPEKDRE